ncbi:MAG: ABC transporter ATP-binding protein [Oscillospiraceae bacterium]|nr:ABC transporter ATP-binding protein [Oscillospiraceae bacterium]
MENSIEIKGISKKYAQFQLNDVSFSVPCGTVMGFIGENGAGKTTTIRAILGLMKPDSGSITVLGGEAGSLPADVKERIGVVFDGLAFPETLNAVQLDKVMSGIYKNWSSETFFGFMDRFSLPLKKKFRTFSRGMEMRLSMAAALSHDPLLLVLDEPTSGLDPVMRSEILDILLDFMQDETHSILISTHITSDLEHIADYITFIHKGRVVFTEDRNEMREKYRILKCTEEDVQRMDKADIIGMKKTRFTVEVLTAAADKYPDIVADVPSIEDIMVYYVKEG